MLIGSLDRLLIGCKEIPVNGILNIADLPDTEPVSRNRTFSGLPLLDLYTGGFPGGELSVWTGKRGEGESTLLSQFVPEVVARNKKVCIYSGEMPAAAFRRILYQQTAGAGHIRRDEDQSTGKEVYHAADEVIPQLDRCTALIFPRSMLLSVMTGAWNCPTGSLIFVSGPRALHRVQRIYAPVRP